MTVASVPLRRSRGGLLGLGALAVLALLGAAVGVYRLALGLGATTNLSDAYPWGLWIGFDFALIAFSGGAFTLAALVHVLNVERARPLLRPCLLTGWLGYLAVLVILLVDLGRPDRFWAFLVYPNLHSPLYEVSWCVLLYTLVLTLELLPAWAERTKRERLVRGLRRVTVPLVIAGITLSMLHQSTLGTIFLAMPDRLDPLWFTPMLPLLFLLSAVGLGLSAALLVGLACDRLFGRPTDRAVLAGLARGSVAVWALYLVLVLGRLAVEGRLGRALALDAPSLLLVLELALGALLPILLFARRGARCEGRGLLLPALLVTAGVTLNRFNVTLTAQAVPAGSGYAPHWMEVAIQVGVLAAAACAWVLAMQWLPVPNQVRVQRHIDPSVPGSDGSQK